VSAVRRCSVRSWFTKAEMSSRGVTHHPVIASAAYRGVPQGHSVDPPAFGQGEAHVTLADPLRPGPHRTPGRLTWPTNNGMPVGVWKMTNRNGRSTVIVTAGGAWNAAVGRKEIAVAAAASVPCSSTST